MCTKFISVYEVVNVQDIKIVPHNSNVFCLDGDTRSNEFQQNYIIHAQINFVSFSSLVQRSSDKFTTACFFLSISHFLGNLFLSFLIFKPQATITKSNLWAVPWLFSCGLSYTIEVHGMRSHGETTIYSESTQI